MAFLTDLRYVMPHRLVCALGEEVSDGGPYEIPRGLRALEAEVVRHHVHAAVALRHGVFESAKPKVCRRTAATRHSPSYAIGSRVGANRDTRHDVQNLAAIQHQDAPLPIHCPSNPFEKAQIAAWLPNLGDALAQGGLHGGPVYGGARQDASAKRPELLEFTALV